MREIFEEVLEDTKEQGALDLIRMQIQAFTTMATGMTPDGVPMMTADDEGNPQPMHPQRRSGHGPGVDAHGLSGAAAAA